LTRYLVSVPTALPDDWVEGQEAARQLPFVNTPSPSLSPSRWRGILGCRIEGDRLEKEAVPDMDITDWIIRAAIFGVLAAVVIGTFQNLYTAIKNRGKK